MTTLESNVATFGSEPCQPQPVGLRYQEMSPEVTLVEFISTSASFHGVKSLPIKDLEWEILKVCPNNIMPANAAAWYMAKRRYYMGNGADNQLLPFLLKNYPRKFAVHGHLVEFLEVYSKDIARRKMLQMIRQGLLAYFSHKVEEYGVYFFDPFYYETVEPFHENLRAVMSQTRKGIDLPRSDLLGRFFSLHKNQFVYQVQSKNLVTISREPVQVCSNRIGVIISMIDNQFGIIQFKCGSSSEKAFFSAKSLFRDGYVFQGDPMKLPPMEFDGYRVPMLSGKSRDGGSLSFTWHAVLVWCGRKPNPKFCSTKEDLINSPYFHGQLTPGISSPNGCVSFDELMVKSPKTAISSVGKGGCMQVGEVLKIRRNGAVVSLGKDSKEEALIPGWSHKNTNTPGNFLTTTQGVELALKDIITFCIDPAVEIGNFKTVGCNVTVLRHAAAEKKHGVSLFLGNDNNMPNDAVEDKRKQKKKRNRKKTISTSDKETSTESNQKTKKNQRKKQISESKSAGEEDEEKQKSRKPKFDYFAFLLTDKTDDEEDYDSDDDPSFMAPPSHDPELDYDEYSDGEVPEEECEFLLKEAVAEICVEELKKKLDKIPEEEELDPEGISSSTGEKDKKDDETNGTENKEKREVEKAKEGLELVESKIPSTSDVKQADEKKEEEKKEEVK